MLSNFAGFGKSHHITSHLRVFERSKPYLIIIIIIISTTMFMVLSSWQSHCESSPGSFDECRMVPSGCRPKTKPDNLGCESACSVQAARNYTHHLMDAGCRQLCDAAASITFCFGLRSEQYFLWSYCIVCSSRCLVRRVVCSSYCVVCSSYCCLVFSTLLRSE